jgi:hypothetical protein
MELYELRGESYVAPAFNQYMAVEGISFLSSWLIFLYLMSFLVKVMSVKERLAPYIIVYNWATLLAYFLLVMPMVALYNLGLIDAASRASMDILVLLLQIYYFWYIARTVLEIDGFHASFVIALDLVLTLFVARVGSAFI